MKTLFEVLNEQKMGQSTKKITVVSKKDVYSPTKTIVYLQALNRLYDYMDFDSAKRYIEELSFTELEKIAKLGIDKLETMCYNNNVR